MKDAYYELLEKLMEDYPDEDIKVLEERAFEGCGEYFATGSY